jgi:hypothetical protein
VAQTQVWAGHGEEEDHVKIGAPKETFEGEARVAMTPDSATQLQKLGFDCVIETGAGALAGFSDASYKAAGVDVVKTAAALFKAADVVVKVRAPSDAEAKRLTKGQTLISFFNPAANAPLMELCSSKGANVIAMDMVPRISRAQKMDALSSMANIAGYRSVIEAGNNFGRFFTGQITAAGKVPPAKPRSARRQALARSLMRLMCAPKWRNKSNPWAPNLSSSILKKSSKMAPQQAAMPLYPALSSARPNWPNSASSRLKLIS